MDDVSVISPNGGIEPMSIAKCVQCQHPVERPPGSRRRLCRDCRVDRTRRERPTPRRQTTRWMRL